MNRSGLVLIPDFRALFTQLTPVQNLKLAAAHGVDISSVLALFPALQRREKLRVADLSGGEQQMLAIARALVQAPKLLLIDEMSMGLAPVVVESLMPIIRSVADEHGASVIMVEQHIQLALEVADEAMVLVHGSVALSGRADTFRTDTERGGGGLHERVDLDDLTRTTIAADEPAPPRTQCRERATGATPRLRCHPCSRRAGGRQSRTYGIASRTEASGCTP